MKTNLIFVEPQSFRGSYSKNTALHREVKAKDDRPYYTTPTSYRNALPQNGSFRRVLYYFMLSTDFLQLIHLMMSVPITEGSIWNFVIKKLKMCISDK